MSASTGLATGSNPSWSLNIWNKVHRYRCLFFKYWWVVLLTVSLALCVTAYFQMNKPTTYNSAAKLGINLENRPVITGDQGGGIAQDPELLLQTQVEIITKVSDVRRNADDILQANYPGQTGAPVALDFSPRNTILTVTAAGPNALYTQRYLQATIEGYLAYRKQQRSGVQDAGFKSLRQQIDLLQNALKEDNQAIIDYQRQVGRVFDTQDKTNENLETLRHQRDTLQSDYDQLMLMTPEQGIDRGSSVPVNRPQSNAANGSNGADLAPTTQIALDLNSTQGEYRQTLANLADLRAKLNEFSRDMTDRHPKIIALKDDIKIQQRRVDELLEFARKRIDSKRLFAATQLKDLDAKVKSAEPQALEDRVQRAKFDQLQETKKRDQEAYDRVMNSLTDATLHTNTTPDPIFIMENASVASASTAQWAKALAVALLLGLATGIGILILVDRLDDRMGSISDFQMHFSEHVLGQIPRDDSGDSLEMLRPDDSRHQLVESYRNLRSTLLFMPLDGARPKTLLVTSAVPNEGKSTTSSNLALVLAFAGMKTLLIDADLRRGAIHDSFGAPRDPGLTDVLGHNVNWKLAIRTTGIENLHVLPRGRNVPQPSEYLLNKATDRLLQELYPLYDYIVIDSSPVLAADDTASLAPKIDATLFVTRMGFTSAKMTRKSLEILYKRQANIPGVILNQVDTSSPEFVYYQYEEYYHSATDEDDADGRTKKTRKTRRSPEKVS